MATAVGSEDVLVGARELVSSLRRARAPEDVMGFPHVSAADIEIHILADQFCRYGN